MVQLEKIRLEEGNSKFQRFRSASYPHFCCIIYDHVLRGCQTVFIHAPLSPAHAYNVVSYTSTSVQSEHYLCVHEKSAAPAIDRIVPMAQDAHIQATVHDTREIRPTDPEPILPNNFPSLEFGAEWNVEVD